MLPFETQLMREEIGCTQPPSSAIKSHPAPSSEIKRHHLQSRAIKLRPRTHVEQSSAIKRNQLQSIAITHVEQSQEPSGTASTGGTQHFWW